MGPLILVNVDPGERAALGAERQRAEIPPLFSRHNGQGPPRHRALTTTLAKAARRVRIFVDYLRNGDGATAVLPWSQASQGHKTRSDPQGSVPRPSESGVGRKSPLHRSLTVAVLELALFRASCDLERAGSYSARARAGLTVAMPIAWEDVRRVHPKDFTISTVPDLLARCRRDPWADLLASKQRLPEKLDALLFARQCWPEEIRSALEWPRSGRG